jgi:hypothetical protein
MHTNPIPESQGTLAQEHPHSVPCAKCNSHDAVSQMWESSCGGYEDLKITCRACGHVRWIDGIDA